MAAISDTVKPGDVITSDLLNRIIALLNQHDALLATSGSTSTGLLVSQLVPAGPYRVGDPLTILGQNFQASIGASRVYLSSTQVTNFLTATDTRLDFVIPPVPGVVESGTVIDLVVLNQTQSVTRSIQLKPQLNPLQGSVPVSWQGVNPNTILAGQPAAFLYRIESHTNNRATWLINPVIDVATNAATWNNALKVLDASSNELTSRQIVDLNPGEARNFFVQLAPVPAGTNGVTFGLSLTASADGITGPSGLQTFTVGTPAPLPDNTFTMNLIPDFSAGALSGSTLTVPGGQNRQIGIDLLFTVAGTYNVTRPVSAGTTGWSVTPFIGTVEPIVIQASEVTSGSAPRRLRYVVAATTGATASGGQVAFTIQRSGQTTSNSVTLNLLRS